jgi:hypothetical protein
MRVYYMTSFEMALKHIFLEQRMKVSRFRDLNDPFELSCHDAGDRNARNRMLAFNQTANEKFGLICFSDNWKSPVMWAHYANKHEGLCLGFDVHSDYIGYVQYIETRLLRPVDRKVQNSIEFIDEMLYHKALEWGYERELRAIVLLDGPRLPMYHIPFGTAIQLREVIIGAKCTSSPRDLAPFILPQEAPVIIRKARAAFKTFEMVENKRYRSVTTPSMRDCQILHGRPRNGPRFLLRASLAEGEKNKTYSSSVAEAGGTWRP